MLGLFIRSPSSLIDYQYHTVQCLVERSALLIGIFSGLADKLDTVLCRQYSTISSFDVFMGAHSVIVPTLLFLFRSLGTTVSCV